MHSDVAIQAPVNTDAPSNLGQAALTSCLALARDKASIGSHSLPGHLFALADLFIAAVDQPGFSARSDSEFAEKPPR